MIGAPSYSIPIYGIPYRGIPGWTGEAIVVVEEEFQGRPIFFIVGPITVNFSVSAQDINFVLSYREPMGMN